MEAVLGWRKGLQMTVATCLSPSLGGLTGLIEMVWRPAVDVFAQWGQVSLETILIQVLSSWPAVSEEQVGGPRGGEQADRGDVSSTGRALKAAEGAGFFEPQHVNGRPKLLFKLIFSSFCVSPLSTCDVPGQASAKCRSYNGV